MKVLVVGAMKMQKGLAAKARKSGGRHWIALPPIDDDIESDDFVDQTAKKLGGEARVIEVEMTLGLRGEDLCAVTYIAPGRQDENDLTDIAESMLGDIDGPFDEDEAARDIAWALVDALAKAMSAQ